MLRQVENLWRTLAGNPAFPILQQCSMKVIRLQLENNSSPRESRRESAWITQGMSWKAREVYNTVSTKLTGDYS